MSSGSIRPLCKPGSPPFGRWFDTPAKSWHSPRAGLFNPLVLSVLRNEAEQNVSKDVNSFLSFERDLLLKNTKKGREDEVEILYKFFFS